MSIINNSFLVLLVAIAGFFDAKDRRIPNKITFTGIVIGILFNFAFGGWVGLLQGLLGTFAGLAIFLLPFAMGGMGAGDVKLMGAIGALMGWKFTLITALYSAVIGGVMVLIYLLYMRKIRETLKKMLYSIILLLLQFATRLSYNETIYKMHENFSKDSQNYKKIYIPYGIAIAGGAVLGLIGFKQGFPIF